MEKKSIHSTTVIKRACIYFSHTFLNCIPIHFFNDYLTIDKIIVLANCYAYFDFDYKRKNKTFILFKLFSVLSIKLYYFIIHKYIMHYYNFILRIKIIISTQNIFL